MLGPAPAVVGRLQAVEVVKEIVGIGRSLSGTLLLYDAAEPSLERLALRRNPACAEGCVRLGHGLTSAAAGQLTRVWVVAVRTQVPVAATSHCGK